MRLPDRAWNVGHGRNGTEVVMHWGGVSALSSSQGCHSRKSPHARSSAAAAPCLAGVKPSCWGSTTCSRAHHWKHGSINCQHKTSKIYPPGLMAQGLTPLHAQLLLIYWNTVVCCFVSILFYYDSAQGNGGHWNQCPEWLHACSKAGTFCYHCFQNEL